ncbi:nicotinate-nucleotide pyrophosphorylase [carboxylating] [Pedococcus cremeus]|uniref:Nicotinate-nucleotide pyrophosphorylase [carboxylating] n=1 Tax=Pedococcus cremeus TaxID=587636 RepID=A0A1H9XUI7_9MICO|nr:carboxylating nicotinate-nucleotide diphosphorylase [Pedococcus cremeus]SES49437.1 nicotinate-nucleotide pyrophosphorylase [carboxylating] [Pedococcus cremeus]
MSDTPADLGFPAPDAEALVRTALDEDLGPDDLDVTTLATFDAEATCRAEVVARADGVVAGLPVVPLVFREVAARLGLPEPVVTVSASDGDRVTRGEVLATVEGRTQVLLIGERTMLNILSRLSGVATHTRRWADALEGTRCTVLDTRKTTPGMRSLQKYAVRAGGGTNKRMGLYDTAMIKDNHKLAAGSLTAAYRAIRERFPDVPVQVEVTTVDEALEAVRMGARFVMCDNMPVELLRETVEAVRATGEQVEIEATGGLTLDVAHDYAATGIDYLSVGGLTHSSPILDIALDFVDA